MHQEAEAQVIDVSRRQAKERESMGNAEYVMKLEAAESKLQELRSNVAVMGKEAGAAMAAVEGQQQRLTLQRLIFMVESERNYPQRVLRILDRLQGNVWITLTTAENLMPPPPSYDESNNTHTPHTFDESTDVVDYFLGEVMHSFRGVPDVELSVSVGDYVVVRKYSIQVSNSGWAEGECKGKAGWFPLDYIERRERVLGSKMAHIF